MSQLYSLPDRVYQLELDLERTREWADTLRQLNKALEDRMDMKEAHIIRLENHIEAIKGELAIFVQSLAAARSALSHLHRDEREEPND